MTNDTKLLTTALNLSQIVHSRVINENWLSLNKKTLSDILHTSATLIEFRNAVQLPCQVHNNIQF